MTHEEFLDVLTLLCDPEEGYYPKMPMSKHMAQLWWKTLSEYPVDRFRAAIDVYAAHNPVHAPSLDEIAQKTAPRQLKVVL